MNKVEIIYTVVYHTMILQWKLYNGAGEVSSFARNSLYKVMFTLIVVEDHLSWGTIKFGGRFIQFSLYKQRDNDKRMYSSDYKLVNDTL